MARQEQFLDVINRDEAERRFQAAVDLAPIGAETVGLASALGRVLARDVVAKIDEVLDELRQAMSTGNHAAMEDELGDLLFAAVNLARQLEIDPGSALRRSNAKFEQRFRAMEAAANDCGKVPFLNSTMPAAAIPEPDPHSAMQPPTSAAKVACAAMNTPMIPAANMAFTLSSSDNFNTWAVPNTAPGKAPQDPAVGAATITPIELFTSIMAEV